ncbi:hypothetical protein Cgig2_000751 [Carnegiea gigantea]|uniref:Uncharacterized protein n=1 Tax=Carnegiea gigantea TaxID=171969 RepID=A0A9Q1QFV2_9CARY|nr:hypothetical protein Cgig2_000751 [Carnegiea gigantea]
MRLPAEVTWDCLIRQCMVGLLPKGEKAQVLLVLSVKQGSFVFGSISSTPDSNNSFSPLHFDAIRSPSHLELRYIKQADEFRMRSQSPDIIRASKQPFLKYPVIQEEGGLFPLSQIYCLTWLLTQHSLLPYQIELGTWDVNQVGNTQYDFLFRVRHQGILADAKTIFKDGVDGLLNLLLKIYDCLRAPISDPYIVREPVDLNLTGFLFSDSEIMGLIVQAVAESKKTPSSCSSNQEVNEKSPPGIQCFLLMYLFLLRSPCK